ncbi:TlpA disulfide reductase family protein [Pedobacter gandavensis]|uniref:Redoxin domain-containing protein n=1 Tax=Pedobacter gandavensis TaxID=2679963 RepID=A0ABR6ETA1_9SPHI|nr:TlpA disulfide reductase family protein [Pedobacter gandavensis]MBB2148490.1 redoxin domain-containing protein [Pedobacter gandavensis]
MKLFLTLFFAQVLFTFNLFADTFTLKGKVTGSETFNYAYVFNNSYKLLDKAKIVDGSYSFNGEIDYKQRFGQIPYAIILLEKNPLSTVELENLNLLSRRDHDICRVLMEKNINLLYNTDQKTFSLSGGELNEVQNLFENALANFRNKRDSIYLAIDKTDLPKKEDKKSLETQRLYTQTMYGFINIIKKHPDSRAAVFNFPSVIYNNGISGMEVLDAFSLFSPSIVNSEFGQYVFKDVKDKIRSEELMAKPAYIVGMKMPAFSLKNERDNLLKGEFQPAKYTLIDFWATWCGPCRKETPNIIKAFTAYHREGFNVMTISIDDEKDKSKWIEALKTDHMDKFTNLFNGGDLSGLGRELKIVSIPTNYLVDGDGIIVATNLRGDMLLKKLQELIPIHTSSTKEEQMAKPNYIDTNEK